MKVVIFLITIMSFMAHGSGEENQFRFPVTKKVLENGLTVIMHEDHSVPTISYHTWFRIGSKDEEPGFTGIAHLFEHMMFKGAKRYSGKEFDGVLHSNGITNNAFTTHDYTGYFEDLPSSKLELVIDVESDRMENLVLSYEGLQSEREVVKEERRMRVDNSLNGVLYENLWATAFKTHSYKWPVIGWMNDLNAINVEKCREFFKNYYSVSNAVVVVTGDFNSASALELIQKYYGKLPKIDVKRPKPAAEPPQTAPRKTVVEKTAQSEHFMVGFPIGKQGDPDSFVLDLISNILSQGPSSRLFKRFVYAEQKVLEINSSAYTPQEPGLFVIHAELKPKVKSDAVLKGVYEELEKIKLGVSPNELEKAKNIVMKQWVDGLKTIHGKAQNLAVNEVVTGNFESLFDDLQTYKKITNADIKRVAATYFKQEKRNEVILMPKQEKK